MLDCINRSDRDAYYILAYYFNTKLLMYLIYLNTFTKPSKCTLPVFDENLASLCTAKHKSTLVENESINEPKQALY